MRNVRTVFKTSHIHDHNWKTTLQRFLCSYRATLHCTMGYPPAQLLFNNRQYKTRLPNATINADLFPHKEVQQNNQRQKAEVKLKANNKAYVKTANLQTVCKVLSQQPRQAKVTSAYDPIRYTITKINSSQITATNKTRTIKKHITFFKRQKSASNQHQHRKPQPSTTGRIISPSTTSEEGDQSATRWKTSQTATQYHNWFSVLNGHNDEQLFHFCASSGLLPEFKLNENS